MNLGEKKYFSLDYLDQIRANNSDETMWFDVPTGFDFVGRNQFFKTVIDKTICLNNEVYKTWLKPQALVYSSVSGTGKTVALLELKEKLKNEEKIQNMNVKVVLAFLGFNSCLQLVEKEEEHILETSPPSYETRASQVLARRLAASTIISMNNPDEISRLPHQNMYDRYDIPSVAQSKKLLVTKTKATSEDPVCIVVCVDEIQLLNKKKVPSAEVPLGRLFLRILRNLQQQWYNDGLRILPVGTGIAIDWTTDATTGENIAIHGGDSTLISRVDFKNIVEKAIDHLEQNGKFDDIFGRGAQKETVIDSVFSAYWPRVRLVEHLKNGNLESIVSSDRGEDDENWLTWLSSWLRDEDISMYEGPIPGKDDPEGKIIPLFTLSLVDKYFRVIPDGFTSSLMIRSLKTALPVPDLYGGLDILKNLTPDTFILKNEQAFEELGFHTVGTAIHVGLYAIGNKVGVIDSDKATKDQMKRLGPSLWFLENSAVTHRDNEILVPIVLGRVRTSLSDNSSDYYPFTNRDQSTFDENVINELKRGRPVYIRCGRQTKCDYLFFYHCGENNSELICMIADAKYSFEGDKQSISTNEQAKLFDALNKVNDAMEAADLQLKATRLVFVSNKTKLAEPKLKGKDGPSDAAEKFNKSKESAQKKFKVELEILNKENFEFGPYSGILFATRNKT